MHSRCFSISQQLDWKFLEISEMWSWRRMEKISWTDRVRNEEVVQSQVRGEYPTNSKKKEG